ncbi:MBL fold metallo-hydrolase [Rubripirellula reticaptiva]|uniref:Putative polyketide biosynthesis zinc-dependent hydrolase BaeB n=1 Tax=Rubripirellula reticaptiva TaxID=2528013 RepID=A0A5C6ERJ8_9BACT|nr:MBL fold metallo-hydrolase [Rubripirellula reticaptiva]TWU51245.1 putative polyketide biosynthesis zinc-dependent hydrolase BaeB [Rubripirellula reticaptiva]
MFVLEPILTDGIAQLSYFVADTGTGTAAVIDPRTDVEIYESLARKHGVSITHIFETHIHADFVSGSRSLADRLGTAKIFLSGVQADYKIDAEPVSDGQEFGFGSFILTARHTPGHTPEHLSFLMCEAKHPDQPWAVFSGDSLFVGSAGRPDLLGSGQVNELAKSLYDTLYNFYLKLEDYVTIYPGHGAGSACGADIGDRLNSTIGYERRTNKFLSFPNFEAFREFVVDDAPPVPWHYPELKKINSAGSAIMDRLPTIPALPPHAFRKVAREPGVTTIDTRSMTAFGGGHVPGSINIAARPEMSPWVGQMFDLKHRLLLVLDKDTDAEQIQRLVVRSGHSQFAGYLAGGMKAWETAGLPLERLEQLSVHELRDYQRTGTGPTILDVRSPDEWNNGHVPGAEHHFIAEMRDRITGLDKEQHYVTYCASGYRASIASSLMKSRGFQHVSNVPGSWSAWLAEGYPVETGKEVSHA